MMRRLQLLSGLVMAVICSSAVSQDDSAQAIVMLEGRWRADCGSFATGAHCLLIWSVGLHSNLMKVQYQVTAATGQRLFAGEGMYRSQGGEFVGYWTDTNGSLHPLQSEWTDNALLTHWGQPETEEGRTRYAINADGSISVTDWVRVNGEWRQFMHADYQRD